MYTNIDRIEDRDKQMALSLDFPWIFHIFLSLELEFKLETQILKSATSNMTSNNPLISGELSFLI